ncbi:MAG TPA: hypothetical protein VK638_55720, partial [Edaphobacter sp.]|nr:hypothetical protein [Edaphobacter sp.]
AETRPIATLSISRIVSRITAKASWPTLPSGLASRRERPFEPERRRGLPDDEAARLPGIEAGTPRQRALELHEAEVEPAAFHVQRRAELLLDM